MIPHANVRQAFGPHTSPHVRAFEVRQTPPRTKATILQWQRSNFAAISHLRSIRCSHPEPFATPPSPAIPTLSFYLDYSLVLINSYALRDLIGLGVLDDQAELTSIYQQSMQVADRMMETILHDPAMRKLMLGIINPQLVMLCHVATETIQAARRNTLPQTVAATALKARSVALLLDDVKRAVPCTSWVALYSTLYKSFVAQLDEVLASDLSCADEGFGDAALTGWWDPVDGGLLDLSSWLESEDAGGLGSEGLGLG